MSIKKEKRKKRKCLAFDCGKYFNSSWEGNRICPECSKKAAFKNGITIFDQPVTVKIDHD